MGIRNYLKRRRERKEKQRERKERIEKRAKVYEIMLTDIYYKMPFRCLMNPRIDAMELAELAENPAGIHLFNGAPIVISDVPIFDGFSFNYHVRKKNIKSELILGWDKKGARSKNEARQDTQVHCR